MNKNSIFFMIAGAFAIVATILLALGFNLAPVGQGAGASFTGFGDLRLYEAQIAEKAGSSSSVGFGDLRLYQKGGLTSFNAAVQGAVPSYVGIGDLRYAEAMSGIASAAVPASSPSYTGFGDLKLFEQKLALMAVGSSYAGMGDLHLFEATH
jgi:hypothetical protein